MPTHTPPESAARASDDHIAYLCGARKFGRDESERAREERRHSFPEFLAGDCLYPRLKTRKAEGWRGSEIAGGINLLMHSRRPRSCVYVCTYTVCVCVCVYVRKVTSPSLVSHPA